MSQRRIGRRGLLKRAAGAATGVMALPTLVRAASLGAGAALAPSDRTAMGFIGVGGRGGALLNHFLGMPEVQVVAVCDVKQPARERARQRADARYGNGSCAACVDFRQLCARTDVDAVAIATPDHWHALQALEAVRAGKDVYVEKPLTVSIEQAKALRAAVRRYGRVFQFGTQERSAGTTRLAAELVRNGRIGRVHTVRVASRYSTASADFPPMPVPDGLDYDLWLGPAPWAPYTASRVINAYWFHISDYTLGFISGCGIHTVNMAMWGMGADATGPVEVEGAGTFPPQGLCDCATDWDVTLRFAGGLVMNFTDGKRQPLGVRFEGTDGWVFVKEKHLGGTVQAEPQAILKEPFGPGDVRLPVSNDHAQNFLDAVRSRGETIAPVEMAVRSDTICHLSDIAMRLGRKLRWDPERETFPEDPEAARMLSRPLRQPWRV